MKTHLLIVSVVAGRLFERSEDGRVICYDLRDLPPQLWIPRYKGRGKAPAV